MGLIEQAAKRLEQLRRAGVILPGSPADAPAPPAVPAPVAAHAPVAPAAAAPVAVRPAAAPVAPASPPAPRGKPRTVQHATIDLARLATEGFVTPDVPRSRIADEFRILKRPLIANATADGALAIKNGNLIMVTSAVPAEGKTFTSVNLAMSIAMELDRTVLLVDGDVARPSLPKTLGVSVQRGLLDALENRSLDLADLLVRTNVPKLTFLPAGSSHVRAAEMLASDAMASFLEELASRYPDRIVIFDSPPVLATTEARQLATKMGQIVFVVHAETTLQSDVKQALATLEACPIKLLVLNGATSSGQGAYGYGYGYGFGG